MPQYGKHSSIGVYPQQFAYAFGAPAIPDGPAALTIVQKETITQGEKSIPISPSLMVGSRGYTQRQVTWQSYFSTPPSVVSLILQGALDDVEADYVTVDESSNVNGETRTVSSNLHFFRVLASTVTGSSVGWVKIALM